MADFGNTIKVVNGYDKDAYTYYPVIVVGAGESGIAMGCQLKEQLRGFDQFRIFERQSGIGGTWWINRYPGCACDIPAIFYSFSFAPNYRWSTFHPPGRDIVQYLQEVCAKYGIVDKVQLNTEVAELRYLVDQEIWEAKLLYLAPGVGDLTSKERQHHVNEKGRDNVILKEELIRAKVVCSAAGGLVEPNTWPESIPGIETFEGDLFHSARWNHNLDLNDKDVIVVGTGCSAAQLVPKLPKAPYNARSVTQLMRSPPWVVPKPQPLFGAEKWEKHTPALFSTIPGLGRFFRTLIFLGAERDFFQMFPDNDYSAKARKKIESGLVDHMKRSVPEKYHEMLTPDYGVGCKRRIFDETWFPALHNPVIELTTLPLTSIQPKGVTLGPGRTYPDPKNNNSKVPTDERKLTADVIVLANGFETTTWLHPLRVKGKDGRLMQDIWDERGGPQAYMGAAMDNYPNLFLIFGPNTATGHSSVILASENMVNYSIHFIKRILYGDVKTFEVKEEAEIKWTKMMQEYLKDTVWESSGCHSWYHNDSGWNATVYPFSQFDYSIRCMFPKWSDWQIQYTRKGLLKKRIRQGLNLVIFAAMVVGLYQARTVPGGISALPSMLRQHFKSLVLGLLGFMNRGISRVQRRFMPFSDTEAKSYDKSVQNKVSKVHGSQVLKLVKWLGRGGGFDSVLRSTIIVTTALNTMDDSYRQDYGDASSSHGNRENGTKRKADEGPPPQSRSKRNRYITIACNQCKRRKIKCNGEIPCQRCGNMQLECIYAPNCCSGSFRDSEEFHSMNESLQSLQEQINNLYAHTNATRGGQEQDGVLHHDATQYPIHPSLEHASPQSVFHDLRSPPQSRGRHSQFQGPTSAAFGMGIANHSLQTMGMTQPENPNEIGEVFEETLPGATYRNEAPTAQMAMHPSKDPLWSVTKDEAVRLCRLYDEEMGITYPIVNLEETISKTKALFTFTESAARTGLIQVQMPGCDSLGTDDNNILKMVLATALIVEGNGQSELGQRLFESVRDASGSTLWEPVELKGLTLLVIVAQYHFHTDDEVRANRIIGLAARLGLEMGLHRRETIAKLLLSENQRSQATQLFWSIYVLDRRWSFGTGMPFAIQDTDIDSALPEPDDGTPYLTAMIPYTRISAKVWYSVNNPGSASEEVNQETIHYLDYQILQWQASLPGALRFDRSLDDTNTGGFSKSQRRLQIMLYLRTNQMRLFLYRPVLYSATSIVQNRNHAQSVVEIAKDTVRTLTQLNRGSDIYRTQQVCFNYFIVSALGALFLAVAHAPLDFGRQVRDEFYMALDLIKGFSTKSHVSQRLWKTIKGLKEIGPKLGLVSRQALTDENDPASSAAVAMAGLAGHQVDERAIFNPTQGPSPLGNVPVDGQQMSLEWTNLFEAAGGYGNMMAANPPALEDMNGLANGARNVAMGTQGMSAIYGNDEEFSRILRDLF